jgi:hypothetical protein
MQVKIDVFILLLRFVFVALRYKRERERERDGEGKVRERGFKFLKRLYMNDEPTKVCNVKRNSTKMTWGRNVVCGFFYSLVTLM